MKRLLHCFLFTCTLLCYLTSNAQTTFTVTSATDNVPAVAGTLRWAIEQVNATAGASIIKFNIPGTGPFRISLKSALPQIDGKTVTIDGTTQPGYKVTDAGNPMIIIDGGGISKGLSLINSTGSKIAGIFITRFDIGLYIYNCQKCRFINNVINRIGSINFNLVSSQFCVIQGNYINTDKAKTDFGTYTEEGLFIQSSNNNLIGGRNCGEGNIIGYVGSEGIDNYSAQGQYNIYSGNIIFGCILNEIFIRGSGNAGKQFPTVSNAGCITSGTAEPNDTVELFLSAGPIGQRRNVKEYKGYTVADGAGNWSMPLTNITHPFVTATATDANHNTSELAYVLPIELDSLKISRGRLSFCKDENITFKSSAKCLNGISFTWDFGDGSPLSSSPNHAYPTLGQYKVKLFVTSQNFHCDTIVDSVIIAIGTKSPIYVSNDTTICNGTSIKLSASGGTSYKWSGGNINSTNPSITVSPSKTTVYYIHITGSCQKDKDTVVVTVDKNGARLISRDTTICLGDSVTLTASGGTTYQWSGGTTSTDSVITVTPSVTTTYILNATGSCNSIKDSIIVTIIKSNTITLLSKDTSICEGQNIKLSATGAINYQWLFQGSIISRDSIALVKPYANATYYLMAVNACSTLIHPINIIVTKPTPVFHSTDTIICVGQAVKLYVRGGITYQWSGGINTTDSIITVMPLKTTTYYLDVTTSCNLIKDSTIVTVKSDTPIKLVSKDTSICLGQSVKLEATGALNYQWYGGSNSTNPTITVTPVITTTYYLLAKNSCRELQDSVKIIVKSKKPILHQSDTTICAKQTVKLIASGATTYQWSGGITSADSVITVTPLTTTVYYLKAGNSCFQLDDSINVTVRKKETVTLKASATTVCSGQLVILTASGGKTYQWYNNATDSILAVTPTVTTTYYLKTTLVCEIAKDSITVNVLPQPVISISNDTAICIGQTVTIRASGATTYQWIEGSTSTSNSITVSPTVTTRYTVVSTLGTCTSLLASATVTVHANPAVSITGSEKMCSNDTVIYTALINGNASPYTYSWSNGTITQSTRFFSTNNTILAVKITDRNGCTAQQSKSITVIPSPQALFNTPVTRCKNDEVTFINQSTGASTYLWNFGDKTTSSEKEPTHLYAKAGWYAVTLIVKNNTSCQDSLTIKNYTHILEIPTASFVFKNGKNTDFTFFNKSKSGEKCVLYFGDGDSLESCDWKSEEHTYKMDGEYTILQKVVNSNGCVDTMKITILAETEGTLFFPNSFTPNGDQLNDSFYMQGSGIKEFRLNIYNRWGELIFTSNHIDHGWDGTFKGEIVEEGVYVWKVEYTLKKAGTKQVIGKVTVLSDK